MLRRTSKKVKKLVDKMRLPAVVRLSRSFWVWGDVRNRTAAEKLQSVMRQLPLMTAWCRISTLELPECDMQRQDIERLAGVLAQCPALVHLDLSDNSDFEAGAAGLAGVLGQCRELVHLNLSRNKIVAGGAESLAGVLPQCAALAHLNLCNNEIGAGGTERLAGVLGQCRELVSVAIKSDQPESLGVLAQSTALTYLNLGYNEFGDAGAESLARVLAQCRALVHLDLWGR